MKKILNSDYLWNVENSEIVIKRSRLPTWLIVIPMLAFMYIATHLFALFSGYVDSRDALAGMNSSTVISIYAVFSIICLSYEIYYTYKNPKRTDISREKITRIPFFKKIQNFYGNNVVFSLEERSIGGRFKHNELYLSFSFKGQKKIPVLFVKDYGIDASKLTDLVTEIKNIGYSVDVIKTT